MYCVQNLSCAVSSPLMYVTVNVGVCLRVRALSLCVMLELSPQKLPEVAASSLLHCKDVI